MPQSSERPSTRTARPAKAKAPKRQTTIDFSAIAEDARKDALDRLAPGRVPTQAELGKAAALGRAAAAAAAGRPPLPLLPPGPPPPGPVAALVQRMGDAIVGAPRGRRRLDNPAWARTVAQRIDPNGSFAGAHLAERRRTSAENPRPRPKKDTAAQRYASNVFMKGEAAWRSAGSPPGRLGDFLETAKANAAKTAKAPKAPKARQAKPAKTPKSAKAPKQAKARPRKASGPKTSKHPQIMRFRGEIRLAQSVARAAKHSREK